jgi:hypothetical protein
MRCVASSFASVRARPMTPNFDALYEDRFADVGDSGDHPAAGLLDEADCLVQVFLSAHPVRDCRVIPQRVDADDVGALGRESDGMGPPLAAGDPGDERHPAVKQAHKAAPPFARLSGQPI